MQGKFAMHLEFLFSLRETQDLFSSSPFIQSYIQSAIVHCYLAETLTAVSGEFKANMWFSHKRPLLAIYYLPFVRKLSHKRK